MYKTGLVTSITGTHFRSPLTRYSESRIRRTAVKKASLTSVDPSEKEDLHRHRHEHLPNDQDVEKISSNRKCLPSGGRSALVVVG